MDRRLEERAIKLSIAGALGMGALGLGFAVLTRSEAILLDGVFSVIGFVISLVTLSVARLVHRPDDESFPFGYSVFEPMLNLAKGLLIAVVILFALFSAVNALLTGGRSVDLGLAVVYAVLACLGCVVFAVVTHRIARQTTSPIVAVDAKNWVIDGAISAAVAITFGVVALVEGSEFEIVAPYADPGVVILLVVGSIWLPVSIIRENWRQIVGMAPEPSLQAEVHKAMAEALASVTHSSHHVRMGRMGRLVYVQLYVVVDAGDGNSPTVTEQDQLRSSLHDRLQKKFPYLAMDVIYTNDRAWAERAITPAVMER